MKNSIKQTLGAAALAAMTLSVIGTGGVMARNKSSVLKPDPPTAEKGKSGTIPPEVPTVEKGKTGWMTPPMDSTVFDPCKNPRPNVQCDPRQGGSSAERNKSGTIKTDPVQGEAPPSAEKGIKDPAVKSCGSCGMTGREAAPPATGAPGDTPPPAVDYEKKGKGQHMERPNPPLTERRAHNGPGGTPPPSADYESPSGGQHFDKGRFPRTIHIVALLGAAAATAGIVASSGNRERPTSP
jgi:hypothetical protein